MAKAVSASIAVVLLGLYAYAVAILIAAPRETPSEPIITILNLVGGLVSALVIAALAITPPSANPAYAIGVVSDARHEKAASLVVGGYLLVWLGCGITLLVRWMQVPDATPILSAAAKSWLGLAIAAAYSYLGLKPPPRSVGR
jgi:predicted metal-binding membrane protein